MKTKFLIISLPSTGKTTLCDRKANELYKLSRKPSGFVFLDFDIRFMRYVQNNLDQIRIDQTKLLISLLNSNDVIGVTGFATQFDFNYLFNCASILFRDIQLRIIFIVPTKRRLGQAVYDCFMRSSSKYTSLFMGDDDISLHMYPWMSVVSDVSRRYRNQLFAFDYWHNAESWLNDYIKRVKKVADLYVKQAKNSDLVRCYFFSIGIGRFVQDVYRLFVTYAKYKNMHGMLLVPAKNVSSHDFLKMENDDSYVIDQSVERLIRAQPNEYVKQGIRLWFERFRYIIPYDTGGMCALPNRLAPLPGDALRSERFSEYMRNQELIAKFHQKRYSEEHENFDDASDVIEPLKDR